MQSELRELQIPPSALNDVHATELVRIWAAKGSQHVSMAGTVWQDPAAWGILLVDLAKHAANVYQQNTDLDQSVALKRIKDGFDAEWMIASDVPTGKIE